MRREQVVPAILFSLLTCFAGRQAIACNEINSANKSLQSRLEVQDEIQQKLDEALTKETTRCQNESGRISSKTAQIAGAQSCIALQESAAFNRELKEISHACASKIDGLKFAMEFVRTTQFTPFRSSIDIVVQSDQGDAFLQKICPGQLSDTSDVLGRTNELLSRSQRSIAKAKTDFEKFSALEAKVAGFELATQGGYDRCVAEGKILNARPVATGAPVYAPAVPQGTSNFEGNTITGVEEENAKRKREREILGF